MGKFKRETYTVDGVKTVVHSAGNGEPVVFFHGAGTVDGFDFAESWADNVSELSMSRKRGHRFCEKDVLK
jgi:predicted esterase